MADYNSGVGAVDTTGLQKQVSALTQQLADLTNQYNTKILSYKSRGETPPQSITTEYNTQQTTLQNQISILQGQINTSTATIAPTQTAAQTTSALPAVQKPIDINTLKKISLDAQAASNALSNNKKEVISGNISNNVDTRIRLRAMVGQETAVYGNTGILSIINPMLGGTDGLIFPYTPTITISHATEYGTTALTHANEDIDHYIRTPSVTISLTAKFTVQNQREGRYALAALHFLRTISKMHFGQLDKNRGLPPPVLIFSGYGEYMFNNLPVIVKSHTYSFDDHTDLVTVTPQSASLNFKDKNTPYNYDNTGGMAKLPVLFSVQVELKVQQTPNRMRTVFNLEEFRTGKLMLDSKNGKGWI